MAVVRNRAVTLLKKTDYQYLYFETGFRFQKRFPVNRKSINSPSCNQRIMFGKGAEVEVWTLAVDEGTQ